MYEERLRNAIGLARAMDATKLDAVIGFFALRGVRLVVWTMPVEYAAEVRTGGVRVQPVRLAEVRALVSSWGYA